MDQLALTEALEQAIQSHRQGTRISHQEMHSRIKVLYTWQDVAKRTEKVQCGKVAVPFDSHYTYHRFTIAYSRTPIDLLCSKYRSLFFFTRNGGLLIRFNPFVTDITKSTCLDGFM